MSGPGACCAAVALTAGLTFAAAVPTSTPGGAGQPARREPPDAAAPTRPEPPEWGFSTEVERLRSLRGQATGLVPLLAVLGLEDYVGDERVQDVLRETTAAATVHPLVFARAVQALALRDDRAGRAEQATTRRAKLGLISRFWVLGPFDGEGRSVLDDPTPIEMQQELPNPERSYHGKERDVRWRRADDAVRGGALQLDSMLRPDNRATAYAMAMIWSDRPRDVALRLGSPGGLRVWCNGRRVLARDGERTAEMDQDAAPARLGAGWNRVLVKTAVGHGAWRIFMRLTSPDGGPLALRAEDDLAVVAAGPRAASPRRPRMARDSVVDVEKLLRARASAVPVPAAAAAWRALGIYLAAVNPSDRQARAAEDAFRRSYELNPDLDVALRWADAAREDDDRRRVLESALTLDGPPALRALLRARLGDVLRSLRREEQAVGRWNEALRLDAACWPAAISLAEQAQEAGLVSLGMARLEALPEAARRVSRVARAQARLLLALGRRQDAERAWQQLNQSRPGDVEALEELSSFAQAREDSSAATAALRKLMALRPDVPSFAIDLARSLEGDGDRAGAASILERAAARLPDDFRVQSELGKVLHRLGRRDEALARLRLALELRPQSPELRRYAERLAAGGESRRPQAEDLAQHHAANAVELVRGAQPTSIADPARVLLDRRVVRVHPNGLSETFAQRVVEILTDRGAEDNREFSIRYTPGDEDVEIREARILRRHKDGNVEVMDAGERGDEDLSEPWYGLYYDERAEVVHFEGLRAGDFIEIQYLVSQTGAENELAGYFGDFQMIAEGLPKLRWQYTLLGPPSRVFHFNQPRITELKRSESTIGSERAYSFDAVNVPSIEAEPAMPGLAELAPYLHVSTYGSWDEVALRYSRLVEESLQPDEAVRRAAREAIKGKTTDAERIRALHALVVSGTRYVGLEFGIHGYKPYRVGQVWQRRFGDCKDKASLLVVMLREIGIPAELALVRTRRGGRLEELPASLAVFDHALAYVPGLDLYLDGTAEWSGVDELPAADQGVMALRIGSRPALVQTPISPSSRNRAHRALDVEIDAGGQAQLHERLTLTGQAAPEWRQHYQTPGERMDRYGRVWSGRFPGARLLSVLMPSIEDRERPVTVDSRATVPHFGAGPEGEGDVSLPLTVREAEFVRNYARLSVRRHDLVLEYPWQHEESLSFRLPEGWDVPWVPPAQTLSTRFGDLRLEVSWNARDRRVMVNSRMDVRQNRVAAADYGEFRRFLADIDAVLSARLPVRKGGR